MKKDKNCHNDQVYSAEGGKLLLSKHFKHHFLPANADLRLLRKYCVFKRNEKKCMQWVCVKQRLILIAFQSA